MTATKFQAYKIQEKPDRSSPNSTAISSPRVFTPTDDKPEEPLFLEWDATTLPIQAQTTILVSDEFHRKNASIISRKKPKTREYELSIRVMKKYLKVLFRLILSAKTGNLSSQKL